MYIVLLINFKETLKERYKLEPDSDEPHFYIELALLTQGCLSRNDKESNEITKQTLEGKIDELLETREPLKEMINIFCYKNTVCPHIIFVVGAPGKYVSSNV